MFQGIETLYRTHNGQRGKPKFVINGSHMLIEGPWSLLAYSMSDLQYKICASSSPGTRSHRTGPVYVDFEDDTGNTTRYFTGSSRSQSLSTLSDGDLDGSDGPTSQYISYIWSTHDRRPSQTSWTLAHVYPGLLRKSTRPTCGCIWCQARSVSSL